MISIRKKLLRSILLVILVVTSLLACITYFSIREEMDEFYDKNLRQVAHTILSVGYTKENEPSLKILDTKLRGEEDYLTQVWVGGDLQYSSYPHINFPLQNVDGRGRVHFEGKVWRYFRQSNEGMTVQLAQDLKERRSVVVEIYRFLLIPIVVQFPILAILIWMLVGYGLKPLNDISDLIRNRNPSFLQPLPNDSVPVEISVLVSELNELLARLKQALESQRRFTADAAHELRTPLTAVRLQLDILKRADDDDERSASIETLEQGVLRSTRLVQQLLELARQEPENVDILSSEIILAPIIKECVEQVLPISQAKNIEIISNLDHAAMVWGNSPQLSIMIGNLINNAINYTNHGGRVEITLSSDDREIILDIADNGIGIPVNDRERIFDRFYRVPGTDVTGSGLGLSIVRNIAEHHKLTIDVSDGIHGAGTTFRVKFKPI